MVFLGLQELTSYDGFIGGIVIPGILAGGVMVLPYIEMFFETFTKTCNIPGFGLLKKELWKMHSLLACMFSWPFLLLSGFISEEPIGK